jgi:hypothetical protein
MGISSSITPIAVAHSQTVTIRRNSDLRQKKDFCQVVSRSTRSRSFFILQIYDCPYFDLVLSDNRGLNRLAQRFVTVPNFWGFFGIADELLVMQIAMALLLLCGIGRSLGLRPAVRGGLQSVRRPLCSSQQPPPGSGESSSNSLIALLNFAQEVGSSSNVRFRQNADRLRSQFLKSFTEKYKLAQTNFFDVSNALSNINSDKSPKAARIKAR